MDNKPIEAPPASTLRETAVKPMLAIKATNPTPTQGLNTVINSTQDFVASGKANVEALAASGQIWVAGVQDLTKQCVTTAKASYEESIAAFKALSAAKSVKEAIDLQGTYSKAMLATTLAESKKLTDASIRLTEQALAPLTARVAVAFESIAKAA
jgi:phasin family protein